MVEILRATCALPGEGKKGRGEKRERGAPGESSVCALECGIVGTAVNPEDGVVVFAANSIVAGYRQQQHSQCS